MTVTYQLTAYYCLVWWRFFLESVVVARECAALGNLSATDPWGSRKMLPSDAVGSLSAAQPAASILCSEVVGEIIMVCDTKVLKT